MQSDGHETTTEIPLMQRLEAKAAERAKIVDLIARMLWESGPQSSDWEGGAPPSWDDITDGRRGALDQELNDAYAGYHLDTWHKAEALLALEHRQCFAVAQILIAEGQRKQEELELQLWRKVERAAGFEPGSLTGKPGVKQRVFL